MRSLNSQSLRRLPARHRRNLLPLPRGTVMEVETQVNLLLAANLLLLTMLVGMTAAQQLQPILRRWMTLLLVKWSLQRTIRRLQQQNLQPVSPEEQ
jgi:hypothetical protein